MNMKKVLFFWFLATSSIVCQTTQENVFIPDTVNTEVTVKAPQQRYSSLMERLRVIEIYGEYYIINSMSDHPTGHRVVTESGDTILIMLNWLGDEGKIYGAEVNLAINDKMLRSFPIGLHEDFPSGKFGIDNTGGVITLRFRAVK